MTIKKKIIASILAIMGANLLLSGCYAQREPQNRNFIMCMGIDADDEGWQITYSFPDLAALTGTGGDGKEPVRSVEAASLREGAARLNASSDKIADYSQLSVILIGASVREDPERMDQLIGELTEEKSIKRTVMMGGAEGDAAELVALDEKLSGSVGVFLYELCQNNYEDRGYDLSILEDFAGGRVQEACRMPIFINEEDRPKLIRGSLIRPLSD